MKNSIRITLRKDPIAAGAGENRGKGSRFGRRRVGASEHASPAKRNSVPQQNGIARISGIVEFVRRGRAAALVPREFLFGGKSRNLIGSWLLVDHSVEARRGFGGAGNHRTPLREQKHGGSVLPEGVEFETKRRHFLPSVQNVRFRRPAHRVATCFRPSLRCYRAKKASSWRSAC